MKKTLAKGVAVRYKETSDGVYIECNRPNNHFFLTVTKEMVNQTLKNTVRKIK